jgi:hypothetical protein
MQPVSLLAAAQGSPSGTQLLSLRHPFNLLAVEAQSAGLSLCRQHLHTQYTTQKQSGVDMPTNADEAQSAGLSLCRQHLHTYTHTSTSIDIHLTKH